MLPIGIGNTKTPPIMPKILPKHRLVMEEYIRGIYRFVDLLRV